MGLGYCVHSAVCIPELDSSRRVVSMTHNLAHYLGEKSVIACGGTWPTPREMVRSGNFREIERRVAAVVEIVRSFRSDGS